MSEKLLASMQKLDSTPVDSASNSTPMRSPKLLIAASGTGGHLFPAIATAQQLSDYTIEWLGVPDRLETELVPPPSSYKLHTVKMSGVQGKVGLGTVKQLAQFIASTMQVRQLLKRGPVSGASLPPGAISLHLRF